MKSEIDSSSRGTDQVLFGSSTAYSELFGKHGARLFRYCCRMLENTCDAEEVLQRACLNLSAASPDVTAVQLFHEASTLLSERLQRRSLAENIEAVAYDDRSNDGLTFETSILRLPPEYKQVFVLKDVSGFSCEEIGTILDLTLSEIRHRLHRARLMMCRSFRRLTESNVVSLENGSAGQSDKTLIL